MMLLDAGGGPTSTTTTNDNNKIEFFVSTEGKLECSGSYAFFLGGKDELLQQENRDDEEEEMAEDNDEDDDLIIPHMGIEDDFFVGLDELDGPTSDVTLDDCFAFSCLRQRLQPHHTIPSCRFSNLQIFSSPLVLSPFHLKKISFISSPLSR
ncbi:hypothetical protein NE237_006567 [Protea cynaroides]|uniref:Uncharacterized protein n=1 Tax=Protea cynaroides TaxID=273540 RepID=A0A9Q0QVF8_9MAGN|nr:hypothetical protein NE237_006567 [Protea cynaroides]